MSKIKAITHVLAVAVLTGAAYVVHFAATPAGQAFVHQYPLFAPIFGFLAAAVVYHKP